jgi:hypothetical protein
MTERRGRSRSFEALAVGVPMGLVWGLVTGAACAVLAGLLRLALPDRRRRGARANPLALTLLLLLPFLVLVAVGLLTE